MADDRPTRKIIAKQPMLQLRFPPEVRETLEHLRRLYGLPSVQDVLRVSLGMTPGKISYTEDEVAAIRSRVVGALSDAGHERVTG